MEIRVIATVNSQYQITAAFLVFGCVLFLRVSEGAVAIAAAHVCYSLH